MDTLLLLYIMNSFLLSIGNVTSIDNVMIAFLL